MGAIEALVIVIVALVIGFIGGGVALVVQLGNIAKNPKVIEETRKAYEQSSVQVKEVVQLAYSILRLAETLSVTVVPASPLAGVIDKGEDILREIIDPAVSKHVQIHLDEAQRRYNEAKKAGDGATPNG